MSKGEVKDVEFGISVCMIVKDEEKNLSRCLESLNGFADELVIVDTGSSDKTVEIAKSFGAKVYEHPWENDFSLHRNQSIGYATKKWVFIIDADAELCYRKGYNASVVRQDLELVGDDVGAVSFDAEDIQHNRCVMSYKPVRMFRRGNIEYRRRVHNKPHFSGKAVHYPHAYVKHYGYDLDPEASERKFKRIMTLLKAELADNPNDYEVYFYMNQAYNLRDDHERSIWAGEEYLKHKDELKRFNQTVYYTLFKSAFILRDKERAEKYLMAGLDHAPDDMDLNICAIEFGVWAGRVDMVERGGEKYLEAFYKRNNGMEDGKKGGFTFTNSPESLSYCLYSLAMAKLQLGRHQLDNLKAIMPAVNPDIRVNVLKQLSEDLKKTGFECLDFTQDEKYMNELSKVGDVKDIEMQLEPVG